MKQFILPDYFSGDSRILLSDKDSHYLKNVLRVKVGAELRCTAPDGSPWRGIVADYSEDGCTLELFPGGTQTETEAINKSSRTKVILYQSLIRGKNMDLIIRQAVEAGVYSIIPVETEYSQIRLKDYKKENPERWQRIIKEAMQQSGTSVHTAVGDMVRLDDIPSAADGDVALFFHQCPLEKRTLHQYLASNPECVSLFIGPEGGLSEKDIRTLEAKGFKSVYLGENILRAETAALYATAIVKNLILESDTWKAL